MQLLNVTSLLWFAKVRASLPMRSRIATLNLEQLKDLGEVLLDFTSLTDLQAWLEALES